MIRRSKEDLKKTSEGKNLLKLDRSKRSSSKPSKGEFLGKKLHPKDDPEVQELAELIRRVRKEHPDRFAPMAKLERSKTQILFTSKDYGNKKGALFEYVRRLPRIK